MGKYNKTEQRMLKALKEAGQGNTIYKGAKKEYADLKRQISKMPKGYIYKKGFGIINDK